MYNAGKIIIGLVLFTALITSPIWYNVFIGKAAPPPELSLDTPAIKQLVEKTCVEPTDYMKSSHMRLLDTWRNEVVRKGKRIYVASNGKTFNMSLTNTCLNCHSNTKQFCNKCHDYVNVEPNCWRCHVIPEEIER